MRGSSSVSPGVRRHHSREYVTHHTQHRLVQRIIAADLIQIDTGQLPQQIVVWKGARHPGAVLVPLCALDDGTTGDRVYGDNGFWVVVTRWYGERGK